MISERLRIKLNPVGRQMEVYSRQQHSLTRVVLIKFFCLIPWTRIQAKNCLCQRLRIPFLGRSKIKLWNLWLPWRISRMCGTKQLVLLPHITILDGNEELGTFLIWIWTTQNRPRDPRSEAKHNQFKRLWIWKLIL